MDTITLAKHCDTVILESNGGTVVSPEGNGCREICPYGKECIKIFGLEDKPLKDTRIPAVTSRNLMAKYINKEMKFIRIINNIIEGKEKRKNTKFYRLRKTAIGYRSEFVEKVRAVEPVSEDWKWEEGEDYLSIKGFVQEYPEDWILVEEVSHHNTVPIRVLRREI